MPITFSTQFPDIKNLTKTRQQTTGE